MRTMCVKRKLPESWSVETRKKGKFVTDNSPEKAEFPANSENSEITDHAMFLTQTTTSPTLEPATPELEYHPYLVQTLLSLQKKSVGGSLFDSSAKHPTLSVIELCRKRLLEDTIHFLFHRKCRPDVLFWCTCLFDRSIRTLFSSGEFAPLWKRQGGRLSRSPAHTPFGKVFDLNLVKEKTVLKDMRIILSGCLIIALKMDSQRHVRIKDVAYFFSASVKEVLKSEQEILNILDFHLYVPTALDFLVALTQVDAEPDTTRIALDNVNGKLVHLLALEVLQLTLLNTSLLSYPRCVLAQAALFIANNFLNSAYFGKPDLTKSSNLTTCVRDVLSNIQV